MVKLHFKDVHSEYVIVPIDKGTGNVDLISQRFYAIVLVKEVGLFNNNNNTKLTNKFLVQ